jgi:hypothetical protein
LIKTQAATLNVIGGQLHGAFGVDVGETLYAQLSPTHLPFAYHISWKCSCVVTRERFSFSRCGARCGAPRAEDIGMKCAILRLALAVVALASSLPDVAAAATQQRTTSITLLDFAGLSGFCDGVICQATFRKDALAHAAPFETTLGELTGVAFQLFHDQRVSAPVECTLNCPFGSSSVEISTDLYLEDPQIGPTPGALISIEGSDARNFGCVNGCTHNYNVNLAGGIIIGDELSRFFGPTTIRFRLFTEIMLVGTQTGPPAFVNLSGDARLVTTYVYTPVPEPGTGMMLAVGMGMLALRRKLAG